MEDLKKYFSKCDKCGEYNGAVKKKIFYEDRLPECEDGEKFITVRCLCNGMLCSKCKINKINRPVSNSYCPESNTIEHWPWFTGWMHCRECRIKEKENNKLNNK